MPFSLPKSTADILAAATKQETRSRKSKTDFTQKFKDRISAFSAQPMLDPSSTFFGSDPTSNTHTTRFDESITPRPLETALEIKEVGYVEDSGYSEGLFDDEPPSPLDNWVHSFISDPMKYTSYFLSYLRHLLVNLNLLSTACLVRKPAEPFRIPF